MARKILHFGDPHPSFAEAVERFALAKTRERDAVAKLTSLLDAVVRVNGLIGDSLDRLSVSQEIMDYLCRPVVVTCNPMGKKHTSKYRYRKYRYR